jgi:mono/diheme cytochrome c family protein
VFQESCRRCHTLDGKDSNTSGGDLALSRLRVPALRSFIRVMPAHLTPAEIAAVADYIHAAERTKAPSP